MREITLDIPLGRIAALRSDDRGPRVLALHGWLDNAASFLPLAPYLRGLDLVVPDLPGHGHSVHLPPGTDYGFPLALNTLLDVADALGWETFCLLGHSMGAGLASLLAAACPQRIERLAVIEMLGALAEAPERTAARMREAIAHRLRPGRGLRVFPDIDTAVRARLQSQRVPGTGLGEPQLRLLVERGLRAVDGGFVWCSDPRLVQPTLIRMTQAQIDDVLRAIECPTLALFADPAQPYLPDDERRRRVALLPQGRMAVLPGGHHLHMQQPEAVAQVLGEFLGVG
ncbi:alpha/beta hydrolase [Thermomonas sp. S9]|uniref:alpha/beta fold hydrolase n=1 Tax=Thermomonas sp. S9 TaxID=2885203 RepID=UPI00216AF60A|nr:alpha/beta hydrolase [Thermomonas sp. S9]MCR6495014.1 alpha/beta hydrolase [Thermomonas sp. S9]